MKILPVLGKQNGVQEYWQELLKMGIVEDYNNPEYILVLGGDGTMLGAQRHYYKRNIPFIGVGFGNINFLLNRNFKMPSQLIMALGKTQWKECESQGMRVFVDTEQGTQKAIAFNDVYVKSAHPAGVVRLSLETNEYDGVSVSGDGIVVASPQGSTAYNRNAGGTILPLGSRVWCITGICTQHRLHTTVAQQKVQLKVNKKTPAIAVTDNKIFSEVKAVRIVPSRYIIKIFFGNKENFEQRRYND